MCFQHPVIIMARNSSVYKDFIKWIGVRSRVIIDLRLLESQLMKEQ